MADEMKKLECCCDSCPKAGDVFVCDCGFAVTVLKDCCCECCGCVCLTCCGKAMTKVTK